MFNYKSVATYADALAAFIQSSPCSFLAADTVASTLAEAGFLPLSPQESWPLTPGGYFYRKDGAVVAWFVPDSASSYEGFRIVGTHTDSPGFKVKPLPDSVSADGWGSLNVETYGGLLRNSWLDRDLGVAGIVVTSDGETHSVKTGPLARIPQLAIHLDRAANESLTLDPQRHLQPVWYVDSLTDGEHPGLLEYLCSGVEGGVDGVQPAQIASYELYLYDTQAPARLGLGGELFASGRQDNLLSVFSGLQALLSYADDHADGRIEQATTIPVLAAFDHEEVGSESATGAAGPLLEEVLERLSALVLPGVEGYRRLLAGSFCLSSDVAHSVHPNYPDKHDPVARPVMGAGVVLKVNANQRYATEARGSALFSACCRSAGVRFQHFVSNNAIPCGSTIAPITATRLGVCTIDVGAPILSMHSAREVCSLRDQLDMQAVMRAFMG